MRKVGDSSSSSSTRGAVPAIAGAALFFTQKQKHNKQPPSLRRAAVFLSILLFIDYLDLFFLADENHSSACAQCQDCQCSSDHAVISRRRVLFVPRTRSGGGTISTARRPVPVAAAYLIFIRARNARLVGARIATWPPSAVMVTLIWMVRSMGTPSRVRAPVAT